MIHSAARTYSILGLLSKLYPSAVTFMLASFGFYFSDFRAGFCFRVLFVYIVGCWIRKDFVSSVYSVRSGINQNVCLDEGHFEIKDTLTHML